MGIFLDLAQYIIEGFGIRWFKHRHGANGFCLQADLAVSFGLLRKVKSPFRPAIANVFLHPQRELTSVAIE